MSGIVLVLARASNGVIGRAGGLPWRLPADLSRFRALTMGHPVLMGRRTWDGLGRPLPGRRNLVLTRDPDWAAEGAARVGSLEDALRVAAGGPELMVIGGAEVARLAEPLAIRFELTEVHAAPEGDTVMAAPDPERWAELTREEHPPESGRPGFAFVTLVRR